MQRLKFPLLIFFTLTSCAFLSVESVHATTCFTKNMGQWPDSILFRAETNESVMWFVKDGVYHQFIRRIGTSDVSGAVAGHMSAVSKMPDNLFPERDSIETTMIKAQFVGGDKVFEVVGIGETEYKFNFFLGNDPSRWRADVPNYQELEYLGMEGQKITFWADHGSQSSIHLMIDSSGDRPLAVVLRSQTGLRCSDKNELDDADSPERTAMASLARYYSHEDLARLWNSQVSVDSTRIFYSTFLGGSDIDQIGPITLDHAGQAYVSGLSLSVDFPAINSIEAAGNGTVFITKLNASGGGPVYTTFFGGQSLDQPADIKVDRFGRAYVIGRTGSSDFPTANSLQSYAGLTDLFIAKISSSGNSLLFSSYLGGSSAESPGGIWIDTTSGRMVIVGSTSSSNFPVLHPIQPFSGGSDIVVSIIETVPPSLLFSTTVGGSGTDQARRVIRDSAGCIVVAGSTSSLDFPFRNPLASLQDSLDVLVMRLSPSGDSIQFATSIGGNSHDSPLGMTLDNENSILVVGRTSSTDFPILNSLSAFHGAEDGFFCRILQNPEQLAYSTLLGGSASDRLYAVMADTSGLVYLAGTSSSTGLLLRDEYQGYAGVGDGYLIVSKGSSDSVVLASYFGGASDDVFTGIALDNNSDFLLSGSSSSSDFPLVRPLAGYSGGGDGVITKFKSIQNICCTLSTGNVDCDPAESVDIADLTRLVDHLFISFSPLCCPAEANIDTIGGVDIADLTMLVDNLFISFAPLPGCP